ncbi:MAG: site-2 protease family protein [Caldilineaceae bacterium]
MMRGGLHIGRIFGIGIEVDWSWFFIFLLVTWNLAIGFAQLHPAWGAGIRWSLAALAALLFFASVLAHELAHSLVAKLQGIPVRNITLFLFGGVSNIQREPPSPRAEFLITIVGPLTSIVLGLLISWLAALSVGQQAINVTNPMAVASQLTPTATILLWLGSINIILGLFNLIPGFPLDGGRILRSILWAGTDNLRQATRWASWVGQTIAWLLIIAGIAMVFGAQIPFFGTGFIGGIWLAFIGWFLSSASNQSYQQVVVHDILADVPVARLMRKDAPTVPANESIADVVHNHIMGTDDHAFPVMEDDQLVGLITLDDIRKVARGEWETTSVRAVMTPRDRLIVAPPEEDAADALTMLAQRDIRQVPVVDHGHLVGVLRRRDIIRWLQLHTEETFGDGVHPVAS